MRKAMLLLLVIVLLVVGMGLTLSAQDTKGKAAVKAADPDFGTWKLNVEKSKMATYKELTVVIRAVGDQVEATQTGTQTDGKPISQKSTYPIQGGALGPAMSDGMSGVVTMISPVNQYLTLLLNGKQVLLNHNVISKDGKTKTITW